MIHIADRIRDIYSRFWTIFFTFRKTGRSELRAKKKRTEGRVEGKSLIMNLNICRFNDSSHLLQIIVVPLLRHEFETQSKYQGVEESFVVRVQI